VDSFCGEFARFNLCAHFLDLRCLLLKLARENLYLLLLLHELFLLLRDRCLQLLNFVIEHGLVLGVRGRLKWATRRRYATLRHLHRRLTALFVRGSYNVPAKVVVQKV
jgi:hypothetical protein